MQGSSVRGLAALLFASLPVAPGLSGQAPVVLEHPNRPVAIEAPAGWTARPRAGDPGVLELQASEPSVRGLLWVTNTEQSAEGYLRKMLGMKPLVSSGDPERIEIEGRPAWRAHAAGREGTDRDVWETLVVARVESATGPAGDNYVLQLWCPAERAEALAPIFDRIVASLRMRGGSS